jgi:hypothetical protein
VPEGDHIRAQPEGNLIDRAAPEAAAFVAAVFGLVFQQPE